MDDALFMRRCFQLAQLGAGYVSPNPLVGAVLVHEGKIIGESWHKRWGEAHAEVNCLHAVPAAHRGLIPASTLYCNLEPCAHFGKTPPCVDLILAQKIRRVVVSNTDPNPLVAGRGLAKLREAGIEVVQGVLETEGLWLNRIFFNWINNKRPYIVLKWAQTADGHMARAGVRTPISGSPAARLVHRWRTELDAILVGSRTAIIDNPRLDVRHFFGKKPLRIVMDAKGRLPSSHHLFDGTQETWMIRDTGIDKPPNNALMTFLPVGGRLRIQDLLGSLYNAGRASLLVEGGAETLHWFMAEDCWDEIRVIKNSGLLGNGLAAPALPNAAVRKAQFALGEDFVRIFVR